MNDQWIMYHVDRQTAVARQRVADAEAAFQQDQDDTRKCENTRMTNREPERTFQEMIVDIGDRLSDLARSNDGEDGEDKDDEEREQGQLSEADEPGWVMGTITKTVQQLMERFL